VAKLHFVTGKGGVGKSTLSACIAQQLSSESKGPVLLCDILGHGSAAHYLGHKKVELEPRRCFDIKNLWVSRTEPHAAFKEYIGVLLALGSSDSALLNATSRIRGSLTDLIADNKIVKAFVKACPGLEPIVMLGKVCWESRNGIAPETDRPWEHIVVDSPASGHFVQLFQSTLALLKVFDRGPIKAQAQKIVDLVKDRNLSKYYLVTLPEELPLQEALDLNNLLNELELPQSKMIINKYPDSSAFELETSEEVSSDWIQHLKTEEEKWQLQVELLSNFKIQLGREYLKIETVPGIDGKAWIDLLRTNFQKLNLERIAT